MRSLHLIWFISRFVFYTQNNKRCWCLMLVPGAAGEWKWSKWKFASMPDTIWCDVCSPHCLICSCICIRCVCALHNTISSNSPATKCVPLKMFHFTTELGRPLLIFSILFYYFPFLPWISCCQFCHRHRHRRPDYNYYTFWPARARRSQTIWNLWAVFMDKRNKPAGTIEKYYILICPTMTTWVQK